MTALFVTATPAFADDIIVFAAASLKEPMDRIVATADNVIVSYGGSGTLARQISLGAPADVVVLAHADWMEFLAASDHVIEHSRAEFLGNRLVLLASSSDPVTLTAEGIAGALNGGRLATGFVASVPAGIYGKAALESLDLWDGVSRQIAEVDSVRAAVALVARGEAPLGIGYATDAALIDGIFAVARFPETSHAPIRYSVAAVTEDGLDFAARLQSQSALAIFSEAGFTQ